MHVEPQMEIPEGAWVLQYLYALAMGEWMSGWV